MISLNKIKTNFQIIPEPKTKISQSSIKKDESTTINLNDIPHYPILGESSILTISKKILNNFKREYDEVKSATYLCEKIKQARRKNLSEDEIEKLYQIQKHYSIEVKKMRKKVWEKKDITRDEYISKLKEYISENGCYINCQECADLILEEYKKLGIKAQNVMIYSINSNGDRTNKIEHIFTIANLAEDADIKKPDTWGKNAVICDVWADICSSATTGIEFYKDFFNIEDMQKISFDFV